MKRRLVISVLVTAGVLLAAVSMIAPAITSQFIAADQEEEQQTRRDNSSSSSSNNIPDNSSSSKRSDSDDGFTEQDEFRQTYQLDKDASVEISSINGAVEVETADGNAAEVHIIRSAKNRDDLEHRKVIVEHQPASLIVRGEEEDEGRFLSKLFGFNPQVRQRVILKVPRQIELSARSVNGRVNIGEVSGPVDVRSVNGKVEVRGMSQHGRISSINGSVALGINSLSGSDGVRVSSVNGAVEMRFTDSLNADLFVSSINGKVSHDVPNMNVQGEYKPTNFRARIGEGGAPVRVSSINGSLRLARATTAAAAL